VAFGLVTVFTPAAVVVQWKGCWRLGALVLRSVGWNKAVLAWHPPEDKRVKSRPPKKIEEHKHLIITGCPAAKRVTHHV